MKNLKKTLNLMFGIIFLLAFAGAVSAQQIDAYLYFEQNAQANSLTVTQGDSFNVIMLAYSYGEKMNLQKLERVPITLFSESKPGIEIYPNAYVYEYQKTYTVNTENFAPGTYTLRFTARTSQTNSIDYAQKTLIVNAVVQPDTTKPLITMLGSNYVNVPVGTPYNDAGATAWDNVDGDITSKIITTNQVNSNVLGIYAVIYKVKDNAGNWADQKTRIVNVYDTTAPVIAILGSNPVNIPVGTPYTDAGATAWDNYDGSLTSSITSTNNVNVNAAGSYYVSYSVYDSAGNQAQAIRTVNVYTPDTTSPVITLLGSNPVNIIVGFPYVDAGATAWDNVNGDLTANIVVTNSVNVNAAGTYTVKYNVQDAAGNSAVQVVRTVNVFGANVIDATDPVITAITPLNGSEINWTNVTFKVSVNENATVKYSLNGGPNVTMNETSPLAFQSVLLNLEAGEDYILTYYATDPSGNIGELTIEFTTVEDPNAVEKNLGPNYEAKYPEGYDTENKGIVISLKGEEKGLNWWQKFINWLCRLFGLDEIY